MCCNLCRIISAAQSPWCWVAVALLGCFCHVCQWVVVQEWLPTSMTCHQKKRSSKLQLKVLAIRNIFHAHSLTKGFSPCCSCLIVHMKVYRCCIMCYSMSHPISIFCCV